jgi:hypothetical protein
MFKREIDRRWGLTAARAWARLLIELIQILVLGFNDFTELGAQARQRQFSRYAMYATATTIYIAPMAWAEGGEGKYLKKKAR